MLLCVFIVDVGMNVTFVPKTIYTPETGSLVFTVKHGRVETSSVTLLRCERRPLSNHMTYKRSL